MDLARRSVLGLAPSALLAPAALAASGPGLPASQHVISPGRASQRYAAAMQALQAYALHELDAIGLPGMTLSIVDDEGFAAGMTVGYADLDLNTPVRPDHVFQIGSISKGFASLCLFTFAEEGKLDLDAPLARYLPDAALPSEPITVAEVMNHCAGLPDDAPIFPRSPDGRLWCGFKPGSRFSYSNTGYSLLGQLIARLAGGPHPEVIRARVLKPLGLEAMFSVIEDRDRPAYANSYSPLCESWPQLTRSPLAAGPWILFDSAAGSLAGTAETMSGYFRFLIRLGRGEAAPLFGKALAKRFITPVIDADEFGPSARYGYGLATLPVKGLPCLHHTGGMMTFTSSFHVDAEAGVACFASVNGRMGRYRPRHTTAYAVELLRAAKSGSPLPAAPDPLAAQIVKRPDVFVGEYRSSAAQTLRIARQGAGMVLTAEGASGRLQPAGEHNLMTDHPAYARHLLSFETKAGAAAASLWWGETRFGRGTDMDTPMPSPALAKLAGLYLSNDPWVGRLQVLARGDKLVLEGMGELIQAPGGYWTVKGDEGEVERAWFEAELNGRPQRLNASGAELLRFQAIR